MILIYFAVYQWWTMPTRTRPSVQARNVKNTTMIMVIIDSSSVECLTMLEMFMHIFLDCDRLNRHLKLIKLIPYVLFETYLIHFTCSSFTATLSVNISGIVPLLLFSISNNLLKPAMTAHTVSNVQNAKSDVFSFKISPTHCKSKWKYICG